MQRARVVAAMKPIIGQPVLGQEKRAQIADPGQIADMIGAQVILGRGTRFDLAQPVAHPAVIRFRLFRRVGHAPCPSGDGAAGQPRAPLTICDQTSTAPLAPMTP